MTDAALPTQRAEGGEVAQWLSPPGSPGEIRQRLARGETVSFSQSQRLAKEHNMELMRCVSESDAKISLIRPEVAIFDNNWKKKKKGVSQLVF